jgi:hypothetical protein
MHFAKKMFSFSVWMQWAELQKLSDLLFIYLSCNAVTLREIATYGFQNCIMHISFTLLSYQLCFHNISNNPAFIHLVFFTQFFQVVHSKGVSVLYIRIRFLPLQASQCETVKWKASAACSFDYGYRSVTSPHGLSNYIDTKAKCCHLKILTCNGTLLQVFIRVYRLEIQSVMLRYFRPSFVNCCPPNLLSSSVLSPPSLC